MPVLPSKHTTMPVLPSKQNHCHSPSKSPISERHIPVFLIKASELPITKEKPVQQSTVRIHVQTTTHDHHIENCVRGGLVVCDNTHQASSHHTIEIWLILPVVICLFQGLSHACLRITALQESAHGSLHQT